MPPSVIAMPRAVSGPGISPSSGPPRSAVKIGASEASSAPRPGPRITRARKIPGVAEDEADQAGQGEQQHLVLGGPHRPRRSMQHGEREREEDRGHSDAQAVE